MDELKYECNQCGIEISTKENQIYMGCCPDCYNETDYNNKDDDLINYNYEDEEDEFDQLDNYS